MLPPLKLLLYYIVLQVYDIDALSSNLRPPPYSNGTPNESVADVLVRVTQLVCLAITIYDSQVQLVTEIM